MLNCIGLLPAPSMCSLCLHVFFWCPGSVRPNGLHSNGNFVYTLQACMYSTFVLLITFETFSCNFLVVQSCNTHFISYKFNVYCVPLSDSIFLHMYVSQYILKFFLLGWLILYFVFDICFLKFLVIMTLIKNKIYDFAYK